MIEPHNNNHNKQNTDNQGNGFRQEQTIFKKKFQCLLTSVFKARYATTLAWYLLACPLVVDYFYKSKEYRLNQLNAQLLHERKKLLQANFKPGFLDRPLTIFQFLFDKGTSFHLVVTSDDFVFLEGIHNAPTLTLNIKDHESCWGLLEGHIDGMDAFMSGIYRADGNIVLSQLVLYLFKSNDQTIIYEVQD